ncbi:hypothetical protein WJX73_010318 [Symbiochloris irregularis]|uniref:Cation efflux protein transmembrane domain-containing protein n=1 Tax=Symbiochloris irregularis TaxID=706552 RepID=A0AAW1PBY8_9CHLO
MLLRADGGLWAVRPSFWPSFTGKGPRVSSSDTGEQGVNGQQRGFSDSARHNGAGTGEGEPVILQPPQPLDGTRESQAHQRELKTVRVAITANIVIFFCKAATCWLTGSSAMFGEAVHSVADTINQVLLRFGILTSQQAPTDLHPYGYLKDKFLWSLVSAVGIFCLGAGVTVAHGVMTLGAPPAEMHHMGWNAAVLVLSFVMEGYSLLVATRAIVAGAAAAGLSFWEYVRRGMDPTSVAVMLEDGAAVTGLIIAALSIAMVHITGNPIYDGIGSITIGVLLGVTAWYLIAQNRSFLIGRSMNSSDMQRVMDLLRSDYVVKAVHDVKSEEIGPGIYRFKAEMEFHGERIVERHLQRLGGTEMLHAQMHSAFMTGRPETLDLFLHQYGSSTIKALGAEVDRLEAAIVRLVPGIRHIDLETDRGRTDKTWKGPRSPFDTFMGSGDVELDKAEFQVPAGFK